MFDLPALFLPINAFMEASVTFAFRIERKFLIKNVFIIVLLRLGRVGGADVSNRLQLFWMDPIKRRTG